LSALLYNANLPGFFRGAIYKGNIKGVCVPGLNCYSCPGAIASCPLGNLQASLGEIRYKLPFYAVGTLLLFGILLGRGICAFLCPFGLIQELLNKIPTPKLAKSRWTRLASLTKYVVLALFVLFLPLFFLTKNGSSVPAFCKYLCPAGTLEGGLPLIAANENLQKILGALFGFKAAVLAIVVLASVFIHRAFCRFLCPLGAIYSLFNKVALFGIEVDEQKCVNCGICTDSCKLDTRKVNDHECIRCGDCRFVCGHNAISFSKKKRKSHAEQTN